MQHHGAGGSTALLSFPRLQSPQAGFVGAMPSSPHPQALHRSVGVGIGHNPLPSACPCCPQLPRPLLAALGTSPPIPLGAPRPVQFCMPAMTLLPCLSAGWHSLLLACTWGGERRGDLKESGCLCPFVLSYWVCAGEGTKHRDVAEPAESSPSFPEDHKHCFAQAAGEQSS